MLALTRRQDTELKILILSVRVTRMERIRNEHTSSTGRILGDKVGEAILRWFGHGRERQ